jgi:two-component system, response regulator PdtaR
MRHYLLLDDNRAFAENLAEILRDEGDAATVVTDGVDALARVKDTRFDAFLTDMKMPGMSGAAAVHHIRRVDPGLAAVVITAYPELAPLQDVAGVFSKPFDTEALLRTLEQAHAARRSAA